MMTSKQPNIGSKNCTEDVGIVGKGACKITCKESQNGATYNKPTVEPERSNGIERQRS